MSDEFVDYFWVKFVIVYAFDDKNSENGNLLIFLKKLFLLINKKNIQVFKF